MWSSLEQPILGRFLVAFAWQSQCIHSEERKFELILAELEEYWKSMSGKVKSRGSTNSANTLEAATTTLNERILKVSKQFVDPLKTLAMFRSATPCMRILSMGWSPLRRPLDWSCWRQGRRSPSCSSETIPRGNHHSSTGMTSHKVIVSWLGDICRYIEEHVQRTGVAIETQGFSFVTSGRFANANSRSYNNFFWVFRRRESLTGNATLHLYPHFKPLQAMPGMIARKKLWFSPSIQLAGFRSCWLSLHGNLYFKTEEVPARHICWFTWSGGWRHVRILNHMGFGFNHNTTLHPNHPLKICGIWPTSVVFDSKSVVFDSNTTS